MTSPPLTHHDIIKQSAPLTRIGLKVNLRNCDRAARYIEFEAQQADNESVDIIHTLEIDEDERQIMCRVAIHKCGLVSVLSAVVDQASVAAAIFEKIPLDRQISDTGRYTVARSFKVSPDTRHENDTAILQLRFVSAFVNGIQLRIDTSTGGGMPADVWMLPQGATSTYIRDTLADGGDIPLDHRSAKRRRNESLASSANRSMPKLPDDILAVLGPQWRPLRFYGDHWKGVLRQLGKHETRTTKAETYIDTALDHLHTTLLASPLDYQPKHSHARWQVYLRRLQPLMLFIGILLLMPISWLFVSSGTMSIHPLALGLTPLLMVGVVVLTAREIPVMEIPPRPDMLSAAAWMPGNTTSPLNEPEPALSASSSMAKTE